MKELNIKVEDSQKKSKKPKKSPEEVKKIQKKDGKTRE